MQKVIIVCLALIALATCLPAAHETPVVGIVRSSLDQEFDGSYKFGFETEDGSSRDEIGTVHNAGSENAYVAVEGSYKYTDPATNEVYEVHYTADENGFVPVGKHIADVISKVAKSAANVVA